MHELDSLIQTSRALLEKKQPDIPIASGNTQFDTAYEIYLSETAQNPRAYRAKWHATCSNVMQALLQTEYPEQPLQFASRVVAMAYILCGHELAQAMNPSWRPGDSVDHPRVLVAQQVRAIMKMGKTIHDYLDEQVLRRDPNDILLNAIQEFYSLSLVALHETRIRTNLVEPGLFKDATDHCQAQLSKFGLAPVIPGPIAAKIARLKTFYDGVASTQLLLAPPLASGSGSSSCHTRQKILKAIPAHDAVVLPLSRATIDRLRAERLAKKGQRAATSSDPSGNSTPT